MEILYVVAGRLDVFINSVKYELTKDDLMVINLNEVHSTQNLSMNNVILVQIPYELLKEYYEKIDNLSFNCNSTLVNVGEAVFAKIKYMIIKLLLRPLDIYKVNPREYCKGFSN